MKNWLIGLLILSGCSSHKKEKDFNESFHEAPKEVQEVQVKAPEKLLEKFEVVKIEETPAPVVVPVPKKVSPALIRKPVVRAESKITTPVVVAPVPVVSKLPSKYPEEMIRLNEKAEKVWKVYKPNHAIEDKIFLDIHFLGMTVGKIMVTNRGKKLINGKEVWHFHSRFKSAPFYSNIYELDDTVDTYVTTDEFLSTRYSLIQRESKQDVDDLQLHDRDQMKTFWFYKQKKSDGTIKNKEKKSFIPYYSIDPFSMLFFFQGLPMNTGDIYEIPILNKAKILQLKILVEGREEIQLENNKKVKAIRVHATTQYTGETLKSGDIQLWFSDDDKHKLLRAKAKIKIGSVTADIVDEK